MSKEVPKEDIKDLLPLVLQLTNVDQVSCSSSPIFDIDILPERKCTLRIKQKT
jgi:hypothetical protein